MRCAKFGGNYSLPIIVCLSIVLLLYVLPDADVAHGTAPSAACVTPEKSVEFRGGYVVLKNFVVSERRFGWRESVTVSAPGDFRFLDNVPPLVERWRGPVSVALYAPGYDFFSTLQAIAYLRNCHTGLVRQLVTFHVFLDVGHMPAQHDKPLLDIYQDEFDCSQKPPYETVRDEEMYKTRMNLTYPINVARNVARLAAQTHFVFPSDIELYPNRGLVDAFLEFAARRAEYFRENSTNVFVLPVFEILTDARIPENKVELKKMLDNHTAITFHQKVCRQCHRIPREEEWINDTDKRGLDAFTVGKRQDEQVIWEPFFIATQKEPLWDERLNWEGQGNKMCQAYYLCLLDYNFVVLDNAFLIHKPGVKKKKVQNVKHQDELSKNNQILRDIQSELTDIYGKNDKCKIHNVFPKNYQILQNDKNKH